MRLLPVVALGLVLIASGCSRFTVRTRQDPAHSFAALRTFGWVAPSDAAPADQRVPDRTVGARLWKAIETELRAKGYVPAGEGQPPDFLVNWRITTAPTTASHGDTLYGAWGTSWWRGWDGGSAVYEDNYDTGTLFLAILDPRTRRIVWIGAAEARLLPHLSLERRLKRVDGAVHDTLEQFPAATTRGR